MPLRGKANLLDYLDWRGDLHLDAVPFSEADSLVLSMLAFVDFALVGGDQETVKLSDAAEAFAALPDEERYMGLIIPDTITDLALKAAHSPRFGETRACRFVNTVKSCEIEQFSAVTFLLPDDSVFIAFRGTDDSLAGWKEDLLLGLTDGVPAQRSAAEYLVESAKITRGDIRLGGHSKGGNLAVWAAVKAPKKVRRRIVKVYSNDGPGFLQAFIESDECKEMSDKIINLVPESSVVGMLLEQAGEPAIIASTRKGILQHDPFSWEIKGDSFVRKKGRSKFGSSSDAAVKKFLGSTDESEKKELIEMLFSVFDATGAETLTDLRANPIRSAAAAQKALLSMDREKRDVILRLLKRIFASPTGLDKY